jgi:hypothetical protein
MNTITAPTSFLIATLIFAAPGQAEELRYTTSTEVEVYSGSGLTQNLALPTFPTARGILSDVRLVMSVKPRCALGIENIVPVPTDGWFNWDMVFGVEPVHEPGHAIVQHSMGDSFQLPPFDGRIDFRGPSSLTTPLTLPDEGSAEYSTSWEWTDAHGGENVRLELLSCSLVNCGGSSYVAAKLWGYAKVTVTVIYSYYPDSIPVCSLTDETGEPLDAGRPEVRARRESAWDRILLA